MNRNSAWNGRPRYILPPPGKATARADANRRERHMEPHRRQRGPAAVTVTPHTGQTRHAWVSLVFARPALPISALAACMISLVTFLPSGRRNHQLDPSPTIRLFPPKLGLGELAQLSSRMRPVQRRPQGLSATSIRRRSVKTSEPWVAQCNGCQVCALVQWIPGIRFMRFLVAKS
jgi:hypothetical protein